MHMWNNPSATDAARSDSSGCASVAMRYDQFIDDCHLETAKLYLGKFGGAARAGQPVIGYFEVSSRLEI